MLSSNSALDSKLFLDFGLNEAQKTMIIEYKALLKFYNKTYRIIGSTEDQALDRQLVDCLLIKDKLPLDSSLLDAGSGNGLPGLVLAIMRPDLKIGLLDSNQKKGFCLKQMVRRMALSNVEVYVQRIEVFCEKACYNAFIIKAVASLPVLLDWMKKPLLEENKVLYCMKGPQIVQEIQALSSDKKDLFHIELEKLDISQSLSKLFQERFWVTVCGRKLSR